MKLDAPTLARARIALRAAIANHLFDPNVNLIDVGIPREKGKLLEDELAIRFHVHKKHSDFALQAAIAQGETGGALPEALAVGSVVFRTDVVESSYRPHLWPAT